MADYIESTVAHTQKKLKWDGTRKNNFSILLTLKEEKKLSLKLKLFLYRDEDESILAR